MKNVILDLDGTVLENDNSLSAETINCIKEISKNNVITIATGRSLVGLPPSILNLKQLFSYYITSNGTSIFDSQFTRIYKDVIETNNIKDFLRILLSNKELVVEILSNGVWHIDASDLIKFQRINVKPQILEYIKKTRKKHDNFLEFLLENNIEIEKISVNLCLPVLPNTINQIHILCDKNNLRYFSDNPHKIDVFKKTTNKATALSFLNQYCKIDLKETVAFGNDENDLEMFKVCAQSVCMAESPIYVKRFASIVLRKNDTKRIVRGVHILRKKGFSI